MTINSSITLEIIFQQCYDLVNLDPVANKNGCLTCFQGIYAGQQFQPTLSELAAVIRKVWDTKLDRTAFWQALANFKKQDGSQAFGNAEIDQVVVPYFEKKVSFSYPAEVNTRNPKNYSIIRVADTLGISGKLTKLVANSDLTDQGWGSTGGSGWAIRIVREKSGGGLELYHQFDFPANNIHHVNPQILRNLVRTNNLPISVKSNYIVEIAAFGWYVGHSASIRNTQFDFYIDVD